MPVNIQAFTTSPTTVSLGAWNGQAVQRPVSNGTHHIYAAPHCRVTLTPKLNQGRGIAGITSLDPQVDLNGDTYFLPFAVDEICSMVLPSPAAAGTLTSFLTTNLSGCKVFVDTVVGGNGSIVVYHANNMSNAPPGHLGGQQPNLELPACTHHLTNLYNTARGHYAAAPHALNLAAGGSIAKPAYNQGSMAEINRKVGQDRRNVEFTGGTIVFGAVVGVAWELYWATYGSCEYDRPWYAPAGWLGHEHHNPTTSKSVTAKMMGSGRFQP